VTDPLIEAIGLRIVRAGRVVLDGVDLALAPGERLFVTGASGAGKTTLLHALLGFVPCQAGTLTILAQPCRGEADFARLRGPLGLLFQDPADQLFGPTVAEDVAFGPLNLGASKASARQTAIEQLRRLDLEHLAGRPVHQLSGGEQRRVALAGVLAMAPRVLLLDEPTTGLDEAARDGLIELLDRTGLPMIVATHDAACIQALATRCQSL